MPTSSEPLALNMSLRHALSQELKAALGQVNHLTLVLVLEFVLGLDLAVRNGSDVLDDVLCLADESN